METNKFIEDLLAACKAFQAAGYRIVSREYFMSILKCGCPLTALAFSINPEIVNVQDISFVDIKLHLLPKYPGLKEDCLLAFMRGFDNPKIDISLFSDESKIFFEAGRTFSSEML